MALKLYDTPLAPNPRRVRWIMAEKGVEDIEIIPVSLMHGEHKAPEYRGKAGLAHLPALELEDGTTITESLAIGRYLETRYPEPNLFGLYPEETAIIEMWTRRMELYLANPMMMHTRFSHPMLAQLETPVPEVGAYNLKTAEKMMKALDRQLAGREFIAADRITTADIVAYTGLDFGRLVKYRPDAALENLARWRTSMKARPAASAGMSH